MEAYEDLVTDIEVLKKALWECYVQSGADTDGDEKFYCPVVMAARITVDAVTDLRKDYDALLRGTP